ncbi:hypothetical protein CUZ56_00420 [Saezia sanguinis]|uniref:DUF2782 domain-containing protein n=1 Tax=Saezia sanguinis TaxID=1965230 RepID=A0A433SGT2_9BURK|nr:hypothetical protein [Saezia sanguinis]RUS67938.1 hypothetical protein CUZ56_00420 [Saezia sanguinis]
MSKIITTVSFATLAVLSGFYMNAQAQQDAATGSSPAPAAVRVQDSPEADSGTPEAKAERIHIDDGSIQIDELRVRGETQSIQVKPQGNMPSYEVVPDSPAQPSDRNNNAGQRVWRVLSF